MENRLWNFHLSFGVKEAKLLKTTFFFYLVLKRDFWAFNIFFKKKSLPRKHEDIIFLFIFGIDYWQLYWEKRKIYHILFCNNTKSINIVNKYICLVNHILHIHSVCRHITSISKKKTKTKLCIQIQPWRDHSTLFFFYFFLCVKNKLYAQAIVIWINL